MAGMHQRRKRFHPLIAQILVFEPRPRPPAMSLRSLLVCSRRRLSFQRGIQRFKASWQLVDQGYMIPTRCDGHSQRHLDHCSRFDMPHAINFSDIRGRLNSLVLSSHLKSHTELRQFQVGGGIGKPKAVIQAAGTWIIRAAWLLPRHQGQSSPAVCLVLLEEGHGHFCFGAVGVVPAECVIDCKCCRRHCPIINCCPSLNLHIADLTHDHDSRHEVRWVFLNCLKICIRCQQCPYIFLRVVPPPFLLVGEQPLHCFHHQRVPRSRNGQRHQNHRVRTAVTVQHEQFCFMVVPVAGWKHCCLCGLVRSIPQMLQQALDGS
mmetsp:Transcript_29868/g.71737  ORF Transcript_29868/g.71737 Transcript_29868/m.71737 type:complete len:319 (-) Transcript_29868:682-1638(-)